jgi:HAD superfamily hydrolase (TIGR01509 family)
MRCNALLLDLDGVLADTEPLHALAWRAVLEGMGASLTPDRWPLAVGTPAHENAAYAAAVLLPGHSAEELLEKKRQYFRSLIPTVLQPFPGLPAELARWKGFPVALATSGARAEALLMLDIIGLRAVFDVIVAYEDVARPKPAPDSYLRAAELLGARTDSCASVEDSPRGLQAAISAGTIALAVQPVSLDPLPAGAVLGFSSTVEALTWLRE